jgi:hypothetical protein
MVVIDCGNDAFLSAAARHYDRLYSDDCECARCSDPVEIDKAKVWDGDEYYCDWCLDKILPRWWGEFMSEVLFEDAGERSAFFAPVQPIQLAAE